MRQKDIIPGINLDFSCFGGGKWTNLVSYVWVPTSNLYVGGKLSGPSMNPSRIDAVCLAMLSYRANKCKTTMTEKFAFSMTGGDVCSYSALCWLLFKETNRWRKAFQNNPSVSVNWWRWRCLTWSRSQRRGSLLLSTAHFTTWMS